MIAQNKTKTKSAMTTGLVLGGSLALVYLLFYLGGSFFETQQKFRFVKHVIFFVVIFIFTKKYRDTYLRGYITYGKSVNYGFISCLYASLITGFMIYLMFKLDSSLLSQLITNMEEVYLEAGLEEDQVEAMSNMIKKAGSPGLMAFTTIFETVFLGLIITLISSIFTKKTGDNDPFNSAMSEVEEDTNKQEN